MTEDRTPKSTDNKGGKQGEFSERGQQQALRPPAQSPARAELPKDPPPSPKDK